mgnify:CR=1 FL=1
MIRLHFIVEGQTEEAFVNQVLAPHLAHFQVYADARCVETSRDRKAGKVYKGGLSSYLKASNDIVAWINEDRSDDARFTTMFDLYALPTDFPGFDSALAITDPYNRVDHLEAALSNHINHRRFIPYIQLHEFEALILAQPSSLDWEYLENEAAIQALVKMVGDQNPELINHGHETAPSKRILKEIPEYDKVTSGVAVAEYIGRDTLRQKCAHFHQWLARLERLANET